LISPEIIQLPNVKLDFPRYFTEKNGHGLFPPEHNQALNTRAARDLAQPYLHQIFGYKQYRNQG
jgi:hypothetical protein